jgi:ABC-type Na+ transport system ATPase subunit NatA
MNTVKNKIAYLGAEIKELSTLQEKEKKYLKELARKLELLRKEFSEKEMSIVSLKEKISLLQSLINKRKYLIFDLEKIRDSLKLNKKIDKSLFSAQVKKEKIDIALEKIFEEESETIIFNENERVEIIP